MSHGEATKTLEKTQSPAVQATQDRKAVDHVSATTETRMEDRRTTEEFPTTQDPPTPAKAERPDGLTGIFKVPFYMVPSGFVSLLKRVMGYNGASAELKNED